MKYTAVIRTLGKAGEKYQKTLDSLMAQTIRPKAIHVYIAEGYPIPKETVGIEKYIYVKKGMVAQRALPYDDITTDYILFLDDDIFLPPNAIETLFSHLKKEDADLISPDLFPNRFRPFITELVMALSGRSYPRFKDDGWANKMTSTAGFSYIKHPSLKKTYRSETNNGPCFLIKKQVFINSHFDDESWLDETSYAMGDDAVMFYKFHCLGAKQLTIFDSGIIHLDARSSRNTNKAKIALSSEHRNRIITWHRFLYSRTDKIYRKLWLVICIFWFSFASLLLSLFRFDVGMFKAKIIGIKSALDFIHSKDYKSLPKLPKS